MKFDSWIWRSARYRDESDRLPPEPCAKDKLGRDEVCFRFPDENAACEPRIAVKAIADMLTNDII